jgi:hypothetical protein
MNFIATNPEENFTYAVLLGTVLGLITRGWMLKIDYRQYPTYLHGRIIHVSLGFIAAALGAVAVPSLFQQNYTAITFLALAAQQFRDVRNMERETLSKVDQMELVPRGAVYIEGIAMVFEGRNYLVIFVAFLTSLATVLVHIYAGVIVGFISLFLSHRLMSGKSVSHVALIEAAPVIIKGPDLYVGDIYMMNVGLTDTQQWIEKYGVGFILTPRNRDCRVTIANIGQRQAILHDVSTVMVPFRDTGNPSLVPIAKLDMEDGRLAIFLVIHDTDEKKAKAVLEKVPLLELAVRMPTEAIKEMGASPGSNAQ